MKTELKTELKPCQCGCDTVEIIHIPGKRQIILTCPKCRITINHKYIRMNPDELRQAIVKAWNTRPIEDALQSRITELEYQLANYKAAADGTTHWCAECKMKDDRITELEKQIVVWHKYPEEKPEKPDGFDGMWLNILTIDECGCTWIGTCRFIGAQLDVLAPQTTKYWAYLPEPPKEESDDKS